MPIPKFTFEPKITLGNIISIAVFIIAGISAVIRAEYRLQQVEDRQTVVEQQVSSATMVSRREFIRELEVAASDRNAVREEFHKFALDVKQELRGLREQELNHFETLIKRIDNLVDRK